MEIIYQCGIIFAICLAGDFITALTNLPIPGNVFGMLLLFILLCTGVLKKSNIKRVSKFLLGNMAFFFIPSGVAILSYYRQIAGSIVPLLLIILFSTIIVMGVTGHIAQLMQRLIAHIRGKRDRIKGESKAAAGAEGGGGVT